MLSKEKLTSKQLINQCKLPAVYTWREYRKRLPNSAQVFYRRFILNNDFSKITVNLETAKERLGLENKNVTNLIAAIDNNVLEPLKNYGLIQSYEKEEGLQGIKYIINRTPRKKIEKSGDDTFV